MLFILPLVSSSSSASPECEFEEERVNSERFFSTSGATDLLNWLSSMSKRIWTMRKEHSPVPARPKRYFAVSVAGESKASVILGNRSVRVLL